MTGRTDHKLHAIVDRIAETLQEELHVRAKEDLALVLSDEMRVLDIQGWLWLIQREHVVLRGVAKALTSGGRDGDVYLILDIQSAISLAGKCVGADPTLLAEHRQEKAVRWYGGALDELGRVVFAAVDTVLRDQLGPYAKAEFTHHGLVRPGFDDGRILGTGEKAVYDVRASVGQHTAVPAYVAIGLETATDWNDRPLHGVVSGEVSTPAVRSELTVGGESRQLFAFVRSEACYRVLRESAEQLGMRCREVADRGIPAGLREPGQIAVLEVTTDSEWFGFVGRLRAECPHARVVLLLHEPSRERVIRGLQLSADAMLGWPVSPKCVVDKLAALADDHAPQTS